MTRRQLFQLAAASGTVALVPPVLQTPTSAAPRTKDSLSFLVFGDWGSGLKLQREVAAAMSRFSREHKPDFAVSVGDNFYDNGVTDASDPQWQTKFERMYPVETMPFPFFAVLGNHDWKSNPATQFSYRGPSGRWRMDGFYFKVAAGDGLLDLFLVDTDLWLPQFGAPGLGAKQTKWLDAALGASKAPWKIVVGHHPPFTDGAYSEHKDTLLVREILAPLLAKHDVQLLLSGHDHDLQHIKLPESKTHFAVCGAGGASLRPRKSDLFGPFYQDLTGGFMGIELNSTELKGRFFNSELKVLHEWRQSAE